MFKESLLQIGFNDKEAQVYLELLRVNGQPAGNLAKQVGMNRSTVYQILSSLEQKGMISSFERGGAKYYSANDPNSLLAYMDMKCKTLDYHRLELLNKIPKFREIMQAYAFKRPVVSCFEGVDGVKRVMYDALSAGKDYCYSYLALEKWFSGDYKKFLVDYKTFRIYKKRLPLRAIVADKKEAREFFEKNYRKEEEMTEVLFVKGVHVLFEDEMMIYDGKVAILHLDAGEEYGIIIDSYEIAMMQKHIFEMAWKGLEISGEIQLY